MQQPTPQAPAPQAAKPKPAPPPKPPAEFTEGAIATMDAAALKAILTDPKATEFQKSKAAVRAGELGDASLIPALAALLANDHLNVYARYGLEPMESPAAGDALRAALPKLKGNLQIGVINSLAKRRDAKAAPVLATMTANPDPAVAQAAVAAIGAIAAPTAVAQLKALMLTAKGLMRTAVADSALHCAERLLASGKSAEALALYSWLSGPTMPKPARLGALAAIIREETTTNNWKK